MKTNVYSGFLLSLTCLLLATTALAAPVKTIDLIQPVTMDAAAKNLLVSDKSEEPFINRTGQVNLETKNLLQTDETAQAKSAGMEAKYVAAELVLTFFPDHEVRILVDSEARPGENLLTLRGHHVDSEIASFSLTVTDKTYLITYQELDTNKVFKVVGDMETGVGMVTEIDLEKLPPVYDSEPMVLPGQ